MNGRISLNVPEAAAALGISERHCWTLVQAGRIPSVRLGRRVLVPVAALEAWINSEANV